MRKLALIPARSGSKRVKDKNITKILGKPLIQYTLELVEKVGFFDDIIVSTDSKKYREIVGKISDCNVRLRPYEISGDNSPDIDWVTDVCSNYNVQNDDALFLLRPTSPLRTEEFIHKAWEKFSGSHKAYDSLRAVKKAEIHPAKMWSIIEDDLLPLLPFNRLGVPWHSNQTAALPAVYQQTASLEIIWGRTILMYKSLSGTRIMPLVCEGLDAFDVNTYEDIDYLKWKLSGERS